MKIAMWINEKFSIELQVRRVEDHDHLYSVLKNEPVIHEVESRACCCVNNLLNAL